MLDRRTLVRLCRARDVLRETQVPAPSIHELARDAGLSPYHFIRRFAAVFGETPHQLRIGARLDRAKLLLACGDQSVTDVCLEVGFASLGSFSDAFARRVGIAPSAYRRTIRTSISVPPSLRRFAGRQTAATVPAELHPACFSLMCSLPATAWLR
jgi:AraC-like DNA-binding protein